VPVSIVRELVIPRDNRPHAADFRSGFRESFGRRPRSRGLAMVAFTLMVDEPQRVYRAREESCANRSSDWGQDASADPLTD
jgi:hypothetical protein